MEQSTNNKIQWPLISVVMTTYNGERFLKHQLDSILVQTYPNTEIIIADDCSTDGTVTILKQYENQYPRIRVVQNKANLGYTKNFARAMLLATGDFIATADQDDIWHPNKLMTLQQEIGDHEMIYSNSELINDEGNSIGKNISDLRPLIAYSDCLMYTVVAWVHGHALMVKKELFQRAQPFPPDLGYDQWFGFVATCKGPIKYLKTPLVYHRQHATQAIGAVNAMKGKKKRKKLTKQQEYTRIRERIRQFYLKCPDNLPQKKIFNDLHKSYQSFSLSNNILRVRLFLKYRDRILVYKNRSTIGKWFFCLRMFAKIK